MLVPLSTLGVPLTAPVVTSRLSTRVVFPEEPCPQKAILRMSAKFPLAILTVPLIHYTNFIFLVYCVNPMVSKAHQDLYYLTTLTLRPPLCDPPKNTS